MSLLTLEGFLVLAGLMLAAMAVHVAAERTHPHRWGSTAFWGVLGAIFVFGKHVPPVVVGYAVVLLAVLAGCRQVGLPRPGGRSEAERAIAAERLGNRVLLPAVLIPVMVVAGGFLLGAVQFGEFRLADPRHVTQIALGLACVVGLVLAMRITGAPPPLALGAGSRLLQAIGWALILPQMLAALGGIFAKAGVGTVVADLVGSSVPTHHPLVAVVTYCAGMALFTIVMGNAFAAFPVITLGIGLPFIVQEHGGDPAIMGALGMLSGYCGTLVTPMAANFNLVPAILLELEDKNAVIKAQTPMAAVIWLFNVALMYFCVYRS